MLEGTLVRLRALEVEDGDRLRTWFNDPRVNEYTSARYPWSLAHEQAYLRDAPPNSFAGGLRLAIDTKEGAHIGVCGLRQTRPEDRKAELAITVGEPSCWSRGYGTDAVLTLLRLAFHEMNLHRVWLTTLEYNERALACYRRCGFEEEGRLRHEVRKHGRHHDFVVMGVLRDEFDALFGLEPAALEGDGHA